MKNNNDKKKYLIASGALMLAMLTATPALADSDRGDKFKLNSDGRFQVKLNLFDRDNNRNDDNDKKDKRDDDRKHATSTSATSTVSVNGTVTAIQGTTITLAGSNGTTYTLNAAGIAIQGDHDATIALSSVAVGDKLQVKGTVNGSVITPVKITDKSFKSPKPVRDSFGIGVVTSIVGNTFTLGPVGNNGTTTVTTNATTSYRIGGQATTSGALSVGQLVILRGAATANQTFAASLVQILGGSFDFLKHFFVR